VTGIRGNSYFLTDRGMITSENGRQYSLLVPRLFLGSSYWPIVNQYVIFKILTKKLFSLILSECSQFLR